jgi:hypothetical protein
LRLWRSAVLGSRRCTAHSEYCTVNHFPLHVLCHCQTWICDHDLAGCCSRHRPGGGAVTSNQRDALHALLGDKGATAIKAAAYQCLARVAQTACSKNGQYTAMHNACAQQRVALHPACIAPILSQSCVRCWARQCMGPRQCVKCAASGWATC